MTEPITEDQVVEAARALDQPEFTRADLVAQLGVEREKIEDGYRAAHKSERNQIKESFRGARKAGRFEKVPGDGTDKPRFRLAQG